MSQIRILVVDDEASIRVMLKMALSKVGYSVRLASGAEEAFEVIKKESIPLMLIDLGLEKMNGFELCRQIRKDNPAAFIYALTGYAEMFSPYDFSEAGFDGYFGKPIRLNTLYKVIGNSFKKLPPANS